jgi:hypothetical protein
MVLKGRRRCNNTREDSRLAGLVWNSIRGEFGLLLLPQFARDLFDDLRPHVGEHAIDEA